MNKNLSKNYLKIGQAAKTLGVSIDTLRRWEKTGKISPIRTPGGTRLYPVSHLKKVNPSAGWQIEDFQVKSLTTGELLNRVRKDSEKLSESDNQTFGYSDISDFSATPSPSEKKKLSFVTKFLISTAVLSIITLLFTSWITASYLTNPKETQQFFKNNIASGLLSPFHLLAEEAVMVISPGKAKELGFIQPEEPPPLSTNYQLQATNPNILAVTASPRFLEVNSDTQINGSLFVRDAINGLSLEATPSAGTIDLVSGDTTLSITNSTTLDQDVSTVSSPTFNTLNLSAASNQLVFQSGGPTGTLTWTPTAARIITLPDATTTLVGIDTAQTLTNKTISGSSNTLSNIPNSALTNSKVTVTAGTNLTGGGDITLGSSITLSLESSPVISGVLKLADGTAAAPALTFTDDTNTGLYRIGADKIGLITGGTATYGITIDSSGNVGIGTISPSATLDLVGTFQYTDGNEGANKVLTSDASGNASWISIGTAGGITGTGTSGYVTKFTGASTAGDSIIYDDGTNIGIGTTEPGSKLELGSGQIAVPVGSAAAPSYSFTGVLGSGMYAEINDLKFAANGGHQEFVLTDNYAQFFGSQIYFSGAGGGASTAIATGNYAGWDLGIEATTHATKGNILLNAYGGNVGIGTTGPSTFELEVAGNIGPEANNTRNLGSAARYFNTAYITNLVTGSSGTVGYWTRTGTTLSPVTAGDSVSLTGSISGTPATNATALTLTGTNVSSANLAYFNAKNTSGTIFNLAYGDAATLTGDLVGTAIDLNDGKITDTAYSVTGFYTKLPTITADNAAGTVYLKGIAVEFGAGPGINQRGAGALTYTAADFLMPALTQTAGTLTANGVLVTTPSSITTGGTAYGVNISPTGIGAGTLNGINIGTIASPLAGTETAMAVGTGWDNVLKVGSTAVINGSGVVQVAAGGTNLTSYTAGDLIYASDTTTFTKLAGGVGNNGKVLVVASGIPSWGVMSGSSCTNCLVNDPAATQILAPTGSDTTGLTIRQTSTALGGDTPDIFSVASSDGNTKYFYVDYQGNVSTGGVASQSLTLTPTTDTTALTLVGTNVSTANLQYINSKNLQGTILNIAYGAAATLNNNQTLIGQSIDLSTNVTANASSTNTINVTGASIALPAPTNTNTSGTNALKGLVITAGSGINQNGAGGTTTFSGADITIPPLTQSAGTLTANGVLVTTPSSITTGGTANGINIATSGVGAGTLNAINIGSITGGAGAETAINIGTGWDYGVNIGAISGTSASAALTSGAISSTGATAYQLNLGAISGANATSHTGVNVGNISGTTPAASGLTLGTLTGGTTSNYQISTGTLTGIASATNTQLNLGASVGAASATTYGINIGAISGAGTATYGINIGVNSSTATTNYGQKIGAVSGAGTTNYGLFVDTVSGASANYAAIFAGGNVGIGTTAPLSTLDVRGTIENGLVAWWPMDENTGTTISDQSINSNTGTLGGGTAGYRPTWATGKFSKALDFDGSDDYVEVANSASIELLHNPLTVEAWIYRRTNSQDWEGIVVKAKAGDPYDGYSLFSMANGVIRARIGDLNYNLDTTSTVSNNVWHHVVLRNDGTNYAIYVDGVKASADGTTGTVATTSTVLWLGRSISAGEYFDGMIDEVRIYNRALSAREIAEHYRQEAPSLAQGGIVSGNLYVMESGNVGIGTTAPGAKTEIASTSTTGGDFLITNTGVGLSGTVAGITANSVTTGDLMTISGTALTTGTALTLTGPSSTGVTDHFVKITSDVGASSSLIYGAPDFSGSAVTGYGLNITATDATANNNTDYAGYLSLALSGNAAKTGVGLYSLISTSSTTADTLVASDLATSTSGIITTGTRNVYGLRTQPVSTAASTGGTTNVYGVYSKAAGVVGAGGTINSYGLYVANGTMDGTGTSTNTGLYVESPTGADNNYAAVFAGGNVGIGTTGPAYKLDIATSTASDRGINIAHTGATGTNYGAYSSVTGAATANYGGYFVSTGATTDYGLSVAALTGATSYGLDIGALSGATANYGVNIGNITSAATANNFGLKIGTITSQASATSYGISTGAISGAGTATYGINIGANSSTATTNYGQKIGAVSGAGTTNYGLYVDTVSGASANYAAIFAGGNVGIGATAPGAKLAISTGASNQVYIGQATDNAAYNVISLNGTVDYPGHIGLEGGGAGDGNLYIDSTNGFLFRPGTSGGVTIGATGGYTQTGTTANTFTGSVTAVGVNSGAGLLQGALGLTITGAAVSLNDSSNFNTTINTGTSTGTVGIGSANAGALTLASGAASSFTVTNANLTLSTTGASGANGVINLTSALAAGNTTTSAFNITTSTDLGAADELLQIGDSAANFVTILGNGNVGIGTTNPASTFEVAASKTINFNSSPVSNLTLGTTMAANSQAITNISHSTIDPTAGWNATVDNTYIYMRGSTQNVGYGAWLTLSGKSYGNPGRFELYTPNATGDADVLRMHITGVAATANVVFSNSNVGIGTTAPGYQLDIAASGTSNTRGLNVAQSGAKTAEADFGAYIANTSTSSTASIAKYGMYITSTGTWDSGVSAPNYGLYIATPTGATGDWDSPNLGLAVFGNAAINSGTNYGENLYIASSGNTNTSMSLDNGNPAKDTSITLQARDTNPGVVNTILKQTGSSGLFTITNNSAAGIQFAMGTTGPGTVATNGTTTLTGTGTVFTNTFKAGDTITVSGETVRTIASIANDTSLTVTAAFSTTASSLSYTLTGGTRLAVQGSGNVGIGTTAPTAQLHLVQSVSASGSPNALIVAGGAHTTLTASAEASDINFNLARTVQFATGALTTQRAVQISAPTYGFVGASTITNAATFYISGAPIAGTNATITNAYALWAVGNARIGAGSLCVKDTDAACAGSTAGTIYATNTTVQAADVAENYISSESLESGEIVKPANDGNNQAVVKSISSYETTLIGIISTRPGVTLSSDTATDSAHPNLYPVALAGRIPVKVSTENGPIEKGDFLTSSSTPGVAMKATQPGQMIGKALESYSDVEIDKIMVFVNVSFADPGNFLASLSLDEEGNLIMPNIKVDKLTVASELRVDGALLAKDNLDPVAPTYTDLNISFKTLTEKESTNSAQIADLTGQVASASAEIASASAALAKVQSDINELKLTPPDILLATGSATLANLEVTSEATVSGMLTAYAAEIQDNFKVLGPSTLATTLIAGDLTVDGTMSISGDSINAISTLYIQNDLLSSSIDFFNGKVTIDKNGNIVSLGEIAAASVVTNKLTISNTPIASGSATLAASIGSETIPAGQTQITISTEDISTGSKVFITPTSVTDKVLSVTSIEEGISFDVSMLSPSTADINFNWWIVGTR